MYVLKSASNSMKSYFIENYAFAPGQLSDIHKRLAEIISKAFT